MLIREFVSLTFFLCVVLAVYIKEALLISKLILHKLRGKSGPSGFLTRPAVAVHILAATGIICLVYGMLVEPTWIEVRRVELSTNKLSRAHLRIVQISDLHSEPKVINERQVIDIVNPLKPDVIIFTGDTVNTPKALPLFKATLNSLKAGMGKFAVTGNYDYWFLRGQDFFGGTGFRELDRDTVELTKDGDTFFITGLGFGEGASWRAALKRVPPGHYSIFLFHKSDLIEAIRGLNVDLYLSGHTHGGQIALPFYGAIITFSRYGKRYEAGEYRVGNTILYVNRGLGLEGKAPIKARFFARPEITVFDIKPEVPR